MHKVFAQISYSLHAKLNSVSRTILLAEICDPVTFYKLYQTIYSALLNIEKHPSIHLSCRPTNKQMDVHHSVCLYVASIHR